MRRLLTTLMLLVLLIGSAACWSDVSSYGRIENIRTNPAALVLREKRSSSFYVSFDYSDSFSDGIFSDTENFSYANNPTTDISACFVGGNLAFTADMGILLSDKYKSTEGDIYYDFSNTTSFRFDMAWKRNSFSFGTSLSGGNLATRLNRKVEKGYDLIGNALFAEYEPESGMEDFQLSLGGMYSEGPYSAGILLGRVLYLEDDELTSDKDILLDNLTFGASVNTQRFTDFGDLRLIRPRLFVSFGNVGSASATMTFGLTTMLQFLPKNEMTMTAAYVRVSDGDSNYFEKQSDYHLFEVTYLIGTYNFGCRVTDQNDRFGLSIFLRYIA